MLVKYNGIFRDEYVISNALLTVKEPFTFEELVDEVKKQKPTFSSYVYLMETVQNLEDKDLIYMYDGKYYFVPGKLRGCPHCGK